MTAWAVVRRGERGVVVVLVVEDMVGGCCGAVCGGQEGFP